ncbi:MAG: sulfotransferase [Deltaproteobacteria bacterium]|nr:sulfotransferase [Deltaproteobacteria bacterium]MBW2359387.1 sulfotransferase [Deltaproteobacteria bacterium]
MAVRHLPPRPDWHRVFNRIGRPEWLPIAAGALLDEARARTGLSDFGGDGWREGFEVFVDALNAEAQLNLVGRVLAKDDLLNWLENRLRITDAFARHPEIGEERIEAPLFITGLPRTGTSILHEVLAQDPAHRAPLAWEVRHPCPPPEAASHATDPRIALTDEEVRFWCEVVPEYDSMHELGAQIPVECVQLTAHEFCSDELPGRHMVPSYSAWLAEADLEPGYRFHKKMLQLLQWKCPTERWVLKAPSHMPALAPLLEVYPDARIVITHRDPLKVMASVASILFSTAWVRSDAVDMDQVLTWFTGETCKFLIDAAESVRANAGERSAQFFDVRYADMRRDPFGTLAGVYAHWGLPFSDEAEAKMRAYLDHKPKGKHGTHQYGFENTELDLDEERRRFASYQARYGVPSEA